MAVSSRRNRQKRTRLPALASPLDQCFVLPVLRQSTKSEISLRISRFSTTSSYRTSTQFLPQMVRSSNLLRRIKGHPRAVIALGTTNWPPKTFVAQRSITPESLREISLFRYVTCYEQSLTWQFTESPGDHEAFSNEQPRGKAGVEVFVLRTLKQTHGLSG